MTAKIDTGFLKFYSIGEAGGQGAQIKGVFPIFALSSAQEFAGIDLNVTFQSRFLMFLQVPLWLLPHLFKCSLCAWGKEIWQLPSERNTSFDTPPQMLSLWNWMSCSHIRSLTTSRFCYFLDRHWRSLLCSLTPASPDELLKGKPHLRRAANKGIKRRLFISRYATIRKHLGQREWVKHLEGIAYVFRMCSRRLFPKSTSVPPDRIRKNSAWIRQAGVLKTLPNCVPGSVGRESDYATTGSNSGLEEERDSG